MSLNTNTMMLTNRGTAQQGFSHGLVTVEGRHMRQGKGTAADTARDWN